ncbi:MAG: TIGR01212 family radical SAM protein [Clostridiales bacterium]|nr:TIGR01212 family radical SAM protein [Clostridiales bacterium]
MITRYSQFNTWLKNKFGERTLKICIDGGFSCPNRDGTKGCGGCIFCGERGSGENTKRIDISTQVKNHLSSYKADRAHKFIAYFQNFSNTYDSIDVLKARYDSALIDDRIVALAVATRPDCIDEEIVKLLSEYQEKYYVYVELGLQTSNESVAQKFNRGYTNEEFVSAVKLLNKYNIDVVTHIMVGLPYEEEGDILNTVQFINSLNIMGVKIHSTYIIKNTALEHLYQNGEYSPISLDYYVDSVCNILSHLNPNIVICRITGDAPKDILVEPQWNARKKIVLNSINKTLNERNIFQGDKFIQ